MSQRETIAEQLFGEALDLPREQRPAFLDRACAGKPALRRMVEDLLDENDRLSGFLSAPVYGRAPVTTAAVTPAVAPGTRLLERYLIVERLGAGGMGVVYRARDEKLDREVAIKMLQPGVLTGEEARARFRREARALAKLNHAHIAAVHDVIEQDGVDFIVMELVAGQSLAAKVREGALPVREATSIALQVAEALEEAHEQGVIHRDLKPANVMITPKGQVKVLDFGLAKLMGPTDATQTAAESAAMGTPLYMSPEQAIGQKADARSDLWSLGVTYYESLAGAAPFKGTSSLAILREITDAAPPPLRGVRADAPLLAGQIVERALEKDPELRYQHARDFATDLRRVMRDLEPGRVTGSAAANLATSGARRKIGVRGVALGAGAVVAVAGLAYWLRPAIAAPRVLGMKQITDDETDKVASGVSTGQRLITDGARLYYEVQGSNASLLKEVSTQGGEAEAVPVGLKDHAAMEMRGGSDLLTLGDPVDAAKNEGAVWHVILPGGQPRRIGDFQAGDASWSPDGGSVYWVSAGVISVTSVDGTDTRKILAANGNAGNIAFSPDGTRMRYSVADRRDSSISELWEAGPDGRSPRHVFSGREAIASQCCGSWTPNGKYYIFQSNRGGTWNVWAVREKQHWWEKVNAAPIQLTVGPMEAELPLSALDGKRIFFVGTSHRGELEKYDVPKKEFVSILPRLAAQDVAYTRDGLREAYISVPDGTLWVSRADGSDRRQLTFAPLTAALPRWSPDGRQIAFMGQQKGKGWRIYVAVVEGSEGNLPSAVTPENEQDGDPSWSADGKSIAYSGLGGQPDMASHPVEVLNLESHQVTSLPDSAGKVGARWSPDGKTLVTVGQSSGAGPLMLFSFTSRQWTRLVDTQASYPTWSHDGKCLYYADLTPGYSIYRVCLTDRKPQLIVDLQKAGNLTPGQFGSWFGLTPDDSILALRDNGIEEIYGLDVDLP
jgi:eukaryotic-like serine/threonine-protein kinase